MAEDSPLKGCKKTRLALLWMNLTSEPSIALYTLLPFILRKDLKASMLQLSLFVALRPVLSVFSFYWGAHLTHRKDKLKANLIGAWTLSYLPFLILPVTSNAWYLLLACGIYQLFQRAGNPALIEILKINIPKKPREHVFSLYYILGFLESVVLGITIADILDGSGSNWKILFFISALVGLSSVFLQMRIPLHLEAPPQLPKTSLKTKILEPLKVSFALMRTKPDFAHFQWGFMIGGFSLMLIAPALSVYYADVLNLSYSNIVIARFILMGIGVTASSLLWKQGLGQKSISHLTALILVGFAIFPLTLLFAQTNLFFLYLAFLFYGIAQAGSHLLWNLSGTLFAQNENSAPYSSTNILMVGIRGAIAPALGGLLCDLVGAIPVLVLGSTLSLFGVYFMIAKEKPRLAEKI